MIEILNARTHNLKNISLSIPHEKIVVITGRSGSGKSSLAVDTIFAEGQRQYFESLSIYSRQFFKQLPAADVERIDGLPPTVCLDQKHGVSNRRSTVGTMTEIYDYLRLLLARTGTIHCFRCHVPIVQHTPKQIRDIALGFPQQTKLMILARMPISVDHASVLKNIRRERLVRVRIDGEIFDIDQLPSLAATATPIIDAITDRIIVRDGVEDRLLEAIEYADRLSAGKVIIASLVPDAASNEWRNQLFGTRYACTNCDLEYSEIQPRTFSFNSPHGACEACEGLGVLDHENSGPTENSSRTRESSDDSADLQAEVFPAISETVCPACHGSRLNQTARSVYFGEKHLGQIVDLSIDQAIEFLAAVQLDLSAQQIAAPILATILHRLKFLVKVGVPYLTLGRSANTLSGGEHQRVRLATSIGSGLTNVGFILDEPSIGLHQRDINRLIESFQELRRAGNSLILIEHDESTMRIADQIIDVGPAAGVHGGQIVAQGTPAELMDNTASLTGDYLAGRRSIEAPTMRRPVARTLKLMGAAGRNLKSVDVEIPLDVLVCVTGVSGSGKSTLINHTLVPAIFTRLERGTPPPQPYAAMEGIEAVEHLVVVDQKPIGKSARGCPATVVGIFDDIRKLFAATKRAKQLGFNASRFSFNAKTGWCPDCRGRGMNRVEMNFLPDVFVNCETCRGRRFNLQTLTVQFHDRSIADVLTMTIEEARKFFDGFEKIARPLQSLLDVGLGYLKLGQPAITLSGGETQRLKLATELSKQSFGHSLYVLDEPTTGLHFEDIRMLLVALNQLVDAGNSMILIEHNLDVVRSADWVIDLGPEGGAGGGEILAVGTPEQIAKNERSFTGHYLETLR